jgi:hypothetical protein
MIKILFLFFFIFSSTVYSAEISEAEKNYLSLSEHFDRFNNIIFFPRKSNERELRAYLVDLIGREILTDSNFVLISPEGIYDQGLTGLVRSDRWLKLIGPLDSASVKNIIGDDSGMLKKWWRTGKLVAASGKVKKFRLIRDRDGNIVELYLDKIKIFDLEKKLEQKPLKK